MCSSCKCLPQGLAPTRPSGTFSFHTVLRGAEILELTPRQDFLAHLARTLTSGLSRDCQIHGWQRGAPSGHQVWVTALQAKPLKQGGCQTWNLEASQSYRVDSLKFWLELAIFILKVKLDSTQSVGFLCSWESDVSCSVETFKWPPGCAPAGPSHRLSLL